MCSLSRQASIVQHHPQAHAHPSTSHENQGGPQATPKGPRFDNPREQYLDVDTDSYDQLGSTFLHDPRRLIVYLFSTPPPPSSID